MAWLTKEEKKAIRVSREQAPQSNNWQDYHAPGYKEDLCLAGRDDPTPTGNFAPANMGIKMAALHEGTTVVQQDYQRRDGLDVCPSDDDDDDDDPYNDESSIVVPVQEQQPKALSKAARKNQKRRQRNKKAAQTTRTDNSTADISPQSSENNSPAKDMASQSMEGRNTE